MPADRIFKLVLQLDVGKGVVADEEGAELLLVELDEPVDEATVGPGGRLVGLTKQVGGAAGQRRDNRLLFVGVQDLFVFGGAA